MAIMTDFMLKMLKIQPNSQNFMFRVETLRSVVEISSDRANQESTPEQLWGYVFNLRVFWCSEVYDTPLKTGYFLGIRGGQLHEELVRNSLLAFTLCGARLVVETLHIAKSKLRFTHL